VNSFFYLILGLALGGLVGWLLRSLRPASSNPALEKELREQLRGKDTEIADLRTRHQAQVDALAESKVEAERARTELKAETKLLADARAGAEERRQAQATAEAALRNERESNAGLQEKVKFLEERLQEERQLLKQMREQFEKDFAAVSLKLLSENAATFKTQSADSLREILQPLKENLNEVKAGMETTRKETQTHSALLKDQIQRIGTEAANLSKALKGDVKALGNWGENMLDQILAKSGLQEGVHYRRQISGTDETEQQRYLDVVVDLPEGRHLVIDSKVSLKNYEEAVNATDDAARSEHTSRLVESLRRHFEGLGKKRYHDLEGINAPDFVLMYVPIEPAFTTAIGAEPELISDALAVNVVLITNSSLLATLRTVAHVWRLAEQQKNAAKIADRGGKLYDKFVGFVQDLDAVGNALGNAQRSFEGARSKLTEGSGNLVRQAEMLRELGAKTDKALPSSLVEKSGAAESAPRALAP
jgi:DNA recombination protein RmuC